MGTATKTGKTNPGFERAARLLNLYGAAGLTADDVQIAVVLHGDAVAAALLEKSSEAPDAMKNANLSLITELNRLGLEILVCG